MLFANQVDKKALLAFLDGRIQLMKMQLEQAEQWQEPDCRMELFSEKFNYEDLRGSVSRGNCEHHPESCACVGYHLKCAL